MVKRVFVLLTVLAGLSGALWGQDNYWQQQQRRQQQQHMENSERLRQENQQRNNSQRQRYQGERYNPSSNSSSGLITTQEELERILQYHPIMMDAKNSPRMLEEYLAMIAPSLHALFRQRLAAYVPPLSEGTTSIKAEAFSGKHFTGITIPSSVTSIGDKAFIYNQLTDVSIPSGVTSIGWAVFFSNKLTTVRIPGSVISIGTSAFGHNQLSNVTIPSSVTSIANSAFADNPLTRIIIGAGVQLSTNANRPSFPNGFDTFYNNGSKKAGTYTYSNGAWSVR